MRPRLSQVLMAGAAVMAVTAFLLYPSARPQAGIDYRFMHCPQCEREYPYNPALADRPCPRCGPKYALRPTTESIGKGGSRSPFTPLLATTFVELNVLLAVVWYVTRPGKRDGFNEIEYRYTRCAGCKKRLRFAAAKVGSEGLCPRCKRSFVFPAGEADEEVA